MKNRRPADPQRLYQAIRRAVSPRRDRMPWLKRCRNLPQSHVVTEQQFVILEILFERVVSEPDENRASVWLARDRFNLPVRVVFDDPKGLRLEQTLVALQTR